MDGGWKVRMYAPRAATVSISSRESSSLLSEYQLSPTPTTKGTGDVSSFQ